MCAFCGSATLLNAGSQPSGGEVHDTVADEGPFARAFAVETIDNRSPLLVRSTETETDGSF